MFISINENIYGENPYKNLTIPAQIQLHRDVVSKRINQLRFGLHELLNKYNPDYKKEEMFRLTDKEKQQEFLDELNAFIVELKLTK